MFTPAHDAVLTRVEWPRYIGVGLPAAIPVTAVGSLVAAYLQPWRVDGEAVRPPIRLPEYLLLASLVVVGLVAAFWRRAARHQLGLALCVLAPVAVINVGGGPLGLWDVDQQVVLYQATLMEVAIVGGTAALRAPTRSALPILGLCYAILLATMAGYPYPGSVLVIWMLALTSATVTGLMGRAVFVSLQSLREAREDLARQAVAEERRRMARDVHDIVAHTLSITMLHLTAARLAVDRAPDRASEALAEAERQGRASLADLRRVVRLLRTEGNDAATAPAPPTLGALDDLAGSYRRAGLDVRLDVAGPPGGAATTAVSPAVGATLYRLAQESLANAAKHGAGAAHVHVAVDDAGARLVVRNPCDAAAAGAAGSGLAGMRERALALGGAFRAGPAADDGAGSWEVDVFLPAEAPS